MQYNKEARQRSELAIEHLAGQSPHLLFCGGFKSNMAGSKVSAIRNHALQQNWGFTRFDYQGHGESPGLFEEGTISCWLEDTIRVIDQIPTDKLVVVGSSMGAWIALLACRQRPHKVRGLLLLAAATDFTLELIEDQLSPLQRETLQQSGYIHLPSDYDDGTPYPITRELLKDSRRHRLLHASIAVHCPIRMIHGSADADIPWQTSVRTLERLESEDARLMLLKGADHRLSDTETLAVICAELSALRDRVISG